MNPLSHRSHVPDTWERGDPYERYMGRWSRRVAPEFLSWLQIPAGRRWLDVGCGTGALCAAILRHGSPASVTGVEPSEGFLETARGNLGGRAVLRQGSATALPLGDATVDVVVSGLVLNFLPDSRAAVAEMVRVTAGRGVVGAYVWDYAGKMEILRHFWDAAVELDPAAAELDEGRRFPLCRDDALVALIVDAGLQQPAATAIDVTARFASFEEYWSPFLGGQGPAAAYASSLAPAARARLQDRLRARLPAQADGSVSLSARAWAVRATVPETARRAAPTRDRS